MASGRIPSVEGGIQPTIVDAKGDLIVATAADTVNRLAVGTNEQRLVAASGETTGLKYVADTTNYAVAAKGDLLVGTAADTLSALSVGTDGYTLVADSGETTGLKWAAPAASGDNWSLLNAGGTALTGAATITVSGISGKNRIMVLLDAASSASASSYISIRVNGSSSSIYYFYGQEFVFLGTYNSGMLDAIGTGTTEILMGRMSDSGAALVEGGITFSGCNSSGVKQFTLNGTGSAAGVTHRGYNLQGYVDTSSTISSISVVSSSGNFDAGTVYVYTTA